MEAISARLGHRPLSCRVYQAKYALPGSGLQVGPSFRPAMVDLLSDDREKALATGCDDFDTQPFPPP
jgi:hypothetical protein